MIQRRQIRVLVTYNKTSYFIDKGVQRGITYDAFRLFETDLNARRKTGNLPIHVVFLPVSRDELADALAKGRGDIVAAGITVTESRLKIADFSEPLVDDVKEVVVTGPGAPAIATLDDLAGQTVHVRAPSLYQEHLHGTERADGAARQETDRRQAAGRRSRGRRHPPDDARRARQDHDRQRLPGDVLEAVALGSHHPRRRGDQGRRTDRVRHAKGQPAAQGGARSLRENSPQGHDHGQRALHEIPEEHEIREGCDIGQGTGKVPDHARAVSRSTAISTGSTGC